jgi:hypothetical protein
LKPGSYEFTVVYDGSEDHEAAHVASPLKVTKEDTFLMLDVKRRHGQRKLIARVVDRDTGEAVAGRRIWFYADGRLVGSELSGAGGRAILELPRRLDRGRHAFKAGFRGDAFYRPSKV